MQVAEDDMADMEADAETKANGETEVKADSKGQDKLFFIVSFGFKMLMLPKNSYLLFPLPFTELCR